MESQKNGMVTNNKAKIIEKMNENLLCIYNLCLIINHFYLFSSK